MSVKKLRIPMIIVVVMLAAACLLTACSGNNHSTENSVSSETSPGTSATTATPETPKKPREITVMISDSSVQPVLKDSPALREILKATNVKVNIEPVPSSDFNAKKGTLIATNNMPDIIRGARADIPNFASSGIFLNISPYLEEYAPNFLKRIAEEPEGNKLKVDGNFYGFPILKNKETANIVGSLPMIRMDVLQELGLPVPTSFDDLYEVLAAFKKAYPDSYPWTMRNGSQYNLRFLAYAFGGGFDIYFEDEQDKYIYGTATQGFKDAIAFLNKLYKDKLLDPNFINLTQQQWSENLSSGKSLFFYDNYTFATNFNLSLQQLNPKANFDMIPILTDNNGNKRSYVGNPSSFNPYLISSKVENPEEIIQLFDWMYSDEGMYATNFGELGTHYTLDGDEVTIAPSVLDEFKNKQDPFRAMQSALGTGLLSFSVFTDDRPMFESSGPEFLGWSTLVKEQFGKGEVIPKPFDPSFSEQEGERLKQLNTKVMTLLDQNIDKFILGTRPLSELDAFHQEIADSGGTEIAEIYNQALARIQ